LASLLLVLLLGLCAGAASTLGLMSARARGTFNIGPAQGTVSAVVDGETQKSVF
jgi:hypothetical protein